MTRKFWLVLALAACACAVAVVFLQRTPSEPAAPHAAGTSVTASPETTIAPVTPAAPAAKPSAGYDRYRAELQRIRAAREKARALQPNEHCINRERYRKVGTTWERAGNC
jgi:hypothetical protein